ARSPRRDRKREACWESSWEHPPTKGPCDARELSSFASVFSAEDELLASLRPDDVGPCSPYADPLSLWKGSGSRGFAKLDPSMKGRTGTIVHTGRCFPGFSTSFSFHEFFLAFGEESHRLNFLYFSGSRTRDVKILELATRKNNPRVR